MPVDGVAANIRAEQMDVDAWEKVLTQAAIAEAAPAASARQYPIFPEEWLVRYLTGSIASLVGPAVMRKRMRRIMRNYG